MAVANAASPLSRLRGLLGLLLVRLGIPPAIIYKRDRGKYLRALQRSDRGEHGPLGELLARAVLDNLYRFIVPAVAGPARLVPLPSLARRGLSADALRVAAKAFKIDKDEGTVFPVVDFGEQKWGTKRSAKLIQPQ